MFSRSSHRTNPASLAALLVGIALIPVGVGMTIVKHRNAVDKQRTALRNEARSQAEALESYFSRARSLTQITARNPAFREFYEEPGTRREKIRTQGHTLREANHALAYLEDLFPASIGEACFIDRLGPENARAVKGRIERRSRLSPDETTTPFFKPAFTQAPGRVFQSRPYVSPDTNEWVIANATPIRAAGKPKAAIVHFEITVESVRQRAAASGDGLDIAIVNANTGDVIIDSRFPQRSGKPQPHAHKNGVHLHPSVPLGRPGDQRFVPLGGVRRAAGTLEAAGRPAAYARVDLRGRNDNKWLVIAASPKTSGAWYSHIGASEIAILIAALVLLGLAIASLRSSQRELRDAAMHDALTGMANRRKLMSDLERGLEKASADRPLVLAIFDLDGFKAYNDTFGHPAGDALLVRLGNNLAGALDGRGTAYRMGGDEFCVLSALGHKDPESILLSASEALTEHGGAFDVAASHGIVVLPSETADISEALRLADQRMYSNKGAGRASAGRQSTDVLVRVLAERDPGLGDHLSEVTRLCAATANRLAIPEEDMTALLQASALHDVGKAAIPDAILNKVEPLNDDDLVFIRRHTVVGERILGAAPALANATKLVRWSHEQFDGRGYPDGLHGDEIPLTARIICVCDAYHAMVSERAYRPARSTEDAVAELRRCAGTQFDPAVVAAFCAALADEERDALSLAALAARPHA